MSYRYSDPTTGNTVQLTDDGRLFLTDNNFGQMMVGLTSEAASGLTTALEAQFGEQDVDLSGADPAVSAPDLTQDPSSQTATF